MKVSLNWLKSYIDIKLPPAEIADKLTMAGTEVKGWQVIGESWEGIFVGEIKSIKPHPDSGHLYLPTVNIGTAEQTVVCGAQNLKAGDKVAFACVGAELIDGDSGKTVRLRAAKIRGVVSQGMVCSEKELGLSDSHEEIMILPAGASVGTPLADYMGDVIFDLDITPNRPDCLSVIGIARELSALTGKPLHFDEISYKESSQPIEKQVEIEIKDPDLCPRYSASLIAGIKVAPSPSWLKQRLLACGMRPINNIVDVTNYVMMEYGEPLHAFSYEQVRGKKVIVRRAKKGEVIETLDGVKRPLSHDMLVIADSERAMAIAGVMGGADTEVEPDTTAILLEAASFNPANIYYTGSTLNLPSEARMRFERGIAPDLTVPALKRATQLITQLAGGEAAKGFTDEYPGKIEQKPISVSTDEVKDLLGVEFSLKQITEALVSLGFDCKKASDSSVSATCPYWRSDINQTVDLIEEVARIIGYDKIPAVMLSHPLPKHQPSPVLSLKRKATLALTGYGFQEVITYSLTSLELLNRLSAEPTKLKPMPLKMTNPMTVDQEYLRPNLRANLLAALEANRRHEDGVIRLFELGKVYLPRANNLPDEPEILCAVESALESEKWWQGERALPDFFAVKGIVESLLGRLGVEVTFEPSRDLSFHPAEQAAITVDGKSIGVIGRLHPKVLDAFEISGSTYLFEINLSLLTPYAVGHNVFQPIPRFPSVVRDIALIVDSGVTHQQVQAIITAFPLVKQVGIFDVYVGNQVPEGKKSLAYRITFQSPDHTLTDEAVDKVLKQILDKLSKELGATLRT